MSKDEKSRFRWPVIGHSNIISFLQQELQKGQIAHAYLFVGPDNIGKTAVANFLANSLVCRHLNNQEEFVPCGRCECCQQINNQIHPDVYWLRRQTGDSGKLNKNISVDQTRELMEKLSLCSFLNTYKVAIIESAQTLNNASANSLLKTLEEPAPQTVLILLANNISDLPSTIASRCQVIKFLPVSQPVIENHLIELGCERKKAKKISALSFGRPGLAIKYFLEPEVYEELKEKNKILISLMRGSLDEKFKIMNEVADSDLDNIKIELSLWKRFLRDLALVGCLEGLVSNQSFLSELKDLSQLYQPKKIISLIFEIDNARRFLDANANPKLTLENLALNF
ncbi:MAG: DNA polymerase III subunit delta' [Candidatus Buchananbacteria bacterium]